MQESWDQRRKQVALEQQARLLTQQQQETARILEEQRQLQQLQQLQLQQRFQRQQQAQQMQQRLLGAGDPFAGIGRSAGLDSPMAGLDLDFVASLPISSPAIDGGVGGGGGAASLATSDIASLFGAGARGASNASSVSSASDPFSAESGDFLRNILSTLPSSSGLVAESHHHNLHTTHHKLTPQTLPVCSNHKDGRGTRATGS